MSQGEQKGSSYILIQHKDHQWIERRDGLNRLPSRYSYYDETNKVVEELNRLADYIKRLEQAGDTVAKTRSCGCPTCAGARDAWLKAKESKP